MKETFKASKSVFGQQNPKGELQIQSNFLNSEFNLQVLSIIIDVSYWMSGHPYFLVCLELNTEAKDFRSSHLY